jgi:hypothetical protein
MVIYPPTLRKKPPPLGLLFDIVVTFSIIETSQAALFDPPPRLCNRYDRARIVRIGEQRDVPSWWLASPLGRRGTVSVIQVWLTDST